MKKISLLAAALTLALAPAAFAQGHGHGGKGPNGGPMQDVVGIEAELIVTGQKLTVYLYAEDGKPVPATGYTGSVLAGAGQARQIVPLTTAAENTLTGAAGAVIPQGTQITLQLKNPAGKSGQAKF